MNWLDLIELVLKLQAERNELRQALVESLEDEAYVDDLR